MIVGIQAEKATEAQAAIMAALGAFSAPVSIAALAMAMGTIVAAYEAERGRRVDAGTIALTITDALDPPA